MRFRPQLGVLAALGVALCAPAARAYTYESALSDGCHEALCASALREARGEHGLGPPIDATDDEQALIDDVPFDLPPDMRDIGAAALLLAARDNDLKGRHPTDSDQLAQIHGDPDTQREHCLRHPADDEPDGTAAALDRCRAYIRDRFAAALDGLDAAGRPDPADRVLLTVYLAFRGEVQASLPRFHVRIGQALHALQDGFTHSLRTDDGQRVTAVLNWVEYVEDTLDERRDGPPHMRELDRCDDPDPLRTRRRELAERATAELLLAALDPALDRAGKEAAADDVLARWLSFEPGCSYDDGWCHAPELAYRDEGACACRAGRAAPAGPWALGAAAVAAALAARRRRGRP